VSIRVHSIASAFAVDVKATPEVFVTLGSEAS
jgi:hypothetical protein